MKNGRSIFPETPFVENHYGAQAMPHATYAAMVSRLDRDVGRILDKLGALGLDRTRSCCSPATTGRRWKGAAIRSSSTATDRCVGFKRDVYEGGIRGPMIVWGPGRIPAARTSDQVWAMWDVLPTLAELAGASAPAGIDGISMVPSLTNRGRQRQHDHLYWEFFEWGSKQAVRMGRWKGVRQPMLTGKLEVYDLQTDVSETRDVSGRHPKVAARLARLMDEAHTPSAVWRAPAEGPGP